MTSHEQQPASIQEKVLEIGTRLKAAPSDKLINSVFAAELSHQAHLFEAMGLVDIAHTLIAIELHTIPKTDGYQLLAQLLELQKKPETFVMIAGQRRYLYQPRGLAGRTNRCNGLAGRRPCPEGSDHYRFCSGYAAIDR